MARRVPVRSSLWGVGWLQNSGSVPARSEADTARLYAELQRRHRLSPYTGSRAAERLAKELLAVVNSRKLPDALHAAFANCARELVASEAKFFQLPNLPADVSVIDGVAVRALIRDRLMFLANDKQHVADWLTTLKRCLVSILDAVPSIDAKPAALVVPVPIVNLIDNVTEIVRRIVADTVRFAPDPRAPCAVPGANLATHIMGNLLAASRTTLDAAQRHPERLRWPGADRATPQEIVSRYLGDTPLASLFEVTIPLSVGFKPRFEGMEIVAPPGHGKTQAMQSMILADLDDPARPIVITIDSQQDMLNVLSTRERFNPDRDDRLVMLDAGDTQWPLRMNIFDIDRARIDKLDVGAREEIYEGVIEIWTYVFGGLLGAELTSRQALTFRFLAQLLLAIPDATIHTLVALLKDPAPYLVYLEQLQPTARQFLADHLFSDRRGNEYIQVRSQLLRRLWHVLSQPTFERMFAHRRNALDFKKDILDQPGRVLFINTAKARLKTEWSRIFGRVCIARLLQATLERAADPAHQRHPAICYIDECAEYIDDVAELFLLQARKYRVGLVLAHQNWEGQIKSPGLRAALSTTAIRFVGEVSAADAAKLAPDLRTTPEFLRSLRKRSDATEFAVHVRGLTPTAVKVSVPFLKAEREPQMSDAAYAKLLARIRAQVAAPLMHETPKQRPHPIDPQSTDADDFGEKY